MHSGEAYAQLRPAISICVLDALLFPSVPDLHLDFRLRNCRHGLVLTDVEFSEAAGVLEMIAQSPCEREMYEARLKFERDQAWRIRSAKDEGRAEGIEEGIAKGFERGEYSGLIRLLQRLLGLPESPSSELATLEFEQLSNLATQMQAQFRNRR